MLVNASVLYTEDRWVQIPPALLNNNRKKERDMAKLKATNYRNLDTILNSRNVMTIGNNTVAYRDNEKICVSLHGHTIVVLHSPDSMEINLCGYPTVTTRDRINQFLPNCVRLYQKNHSQYLADSMFTIEIDSKITYTIQNSSCGWTVNSDQFVFAKPLA